MKIIALGLLIYLGLTSCNQNASKQANTTFITDKEFFTLYKKTEGVIQVARALTTNNKTFDLYLSEVNISKPEASKQTFVSVERLTKQQFDNRKTKIQSAYNWKPFNGNEVLFVQIQPKGFKDETQLLDKRQEIEDELSNALENKNLGKWFASDLGPGGGNMLYTVTDIDLSMHAILEILQQNKLEKNVLIGRRVLVDKDDWFYEVIYPTKYSGNFNTM